jgi:hypothetical protein
MPVVDEAGGERDLRQTLEARAQDAERFRGAAGDEDLELA